MTTNPRIRAVRPAVAVLGLALVVGLAGGCTLPDGGTGSVATTTGAPTRTTAPTATTQSLNLPDVKTAQLAACDSDFQTLRSAESTYAMVNDGHYATIRQLVSGRYIQGPETYYVGIRIGTPVGGYTLLAAPAGPCVSLPVRDAP